MLGFYFERPRHGDRQVRDIERHTAPALQRGRGRRVPVTAMPDRVRDVVSNPFNYRRESFFIRQAGPGYLFCLFHYGGAIGIAQARYRDGLSVFFEDGRG